MKILEYNDIDYSRVKRQYEKVTSCLERDDFRSAAVKKLAEQDLYSARLDDSNRLIFKLVQYQKMRYALLLEVVLNHAYDKSKFLRGAKIDEAKIPQIESQTHIIDEALPSVGYINPSERRFHFLDKIISFDPEQQKTYQAHFPLIIIGPAGSGKTVLTLEKMKSFHGDGIYVTLSPYLSENARNLYYSTELETKKITRILQSNFRNSKTITGLANKLIRIKQKRFGSIDRESTYLMNSLSEKSGEVIFLKDTDRVKSELNKNIRRSAKFALIVMRNEEKALARKHFDTPLIFTVQEAKGLEYENVILLNFVSGERQSFQEIVNGVNEEDMERDIRYLRASDKTDKSLEVYKFFINSLYVAVTRAIERIYLIESDTGHPLLQMLELQKALEQLAMKTQQSTSEEWQAEARRLELQGKQEQADEIRRTILKTQPVPWDVYTLKRVMELAVQIRTAKDNPQRPRKALFEYALFYDSLAIIGFLSEHNFDKARQIYSLNQNKQFFNRPLYEQQKTNLVARTLQNYTGNIKEVIRQCGIYGIDHRTEYNATPLMLAARTGAVPLIKELLSAGANTDLTDNCGMTAWQIFLQRAIKDKNIEPSIFFKVNEMLIPSSISLKVDDRLIKLGGSQGEFMLFHIFFVILLPSLIYPALEQVTFTAGQLAEIMASLPDSVIAEYRKKRQYITSLLAKNEINSQNPYNKKLFKRIKMGYYILNPEIQIRQQDDWKNIYSFAGFELISRIFSKETV